ncbi:MFS transporter [Schaalia sp. lx-260]|uniref:MFS transporter n=1 Tax=Schaalia sp. lx-260 TaxID=2899082 RepID=UPI001E4B8F97|nr:MFS transporter [Schaalia sp. lx-260]MCD4550186.1 MFS transporter [Schaalia sp. lx-260]
MPFSSHDDSARPLNPRHNDSSQTENRQKNLKNTEIHTSEHQTQKVAWNRLEIMLLVGSVILITLNAFEALATTTAMPTVVQELGAHTWFSVATGSALAAQLSATVLAGALSDSRGPRFVLILGMGLFVLGLTLCALSGHILLFVIGRIIQGCGGGFVIVPLYVLIGALVQDVHRPTVFAGFSLAWVLPSLIGPGIAGWVTGHIGWRPVFGAVPFLCLLALFPLIQVLRHLNTGEKQKNPLLFSLTLMSCGCGIGVLALQLSGATSGLLSYLLTVFGLALTIGVLPRLLPRGTCRARSGLPSLILTRLLAMGAEMGATAFLPLLLQHVHAWSADAASIAVTIGAVSWAAGSTIQSRIRNPRWRARLPFVGTLLLSIGVIPFLVLAWPGAPIWPALVSWLFAGAGVGLMHSTISVLALAVTPPEKHGKVSSWLQVADSAGAAVFMAIASLILALWGTHIPVGGPEYLPACVLLFVVSVSATCVAYRFRADTVSALHRA